MSDGSVEDSMPFHGEHSGAKVHAREIGQTIASSVGVASMLGASVIIGAYLKTSWGAWRVPGRKTTLEQKVKALAEGYMLQLFWLSVSDWFSGLAFGISRFTIPPDFETVNTACRVQTVSIAYFPLCSVFWTAILAFELHRFVVYPHWDLDGTFSRRRYGWYHVLGWGVPAILTAVVFVLMKPKNAGIWCWFNEPSGIHATFYAIYLVATLTWGSIVALYIHMVVEVCRVVRRENRKISNHVKSIFLALVLYPLVFLVVFVFQFLNRTGIGTTGYDRMFSSKFFAYATAATAPAQGFLNALVYVTTSRKVRNLICPRRRDKETQIQDRLISASKDGDDASRRSQSAIVLYSAEDLAEEQTGSTSSTSADDSGDVASTELPVEYREAC
eukprot:gb/GECG01006137.1/.p1 GENE.gb/GECG01006137.1/~~gb/GECG01006137.1/.p1  ORF type:complete len:387 (+),score=14.40 gb/GECG01006137.1/:1-1161(+)